MSWSLQEAWKLRGSSCESRAVKGAGVEVWGRLLPLWVCRQASGGELGLPDGCLNVQWNGIIVVFLVEVFLPLELTLLDQQNVKLWEQEAKLLWVDHRGWQWVSGPLLFAAFDSWTHNFWQWEKQHLLLHSDAGHVLGASPQPCKVLPSSRHCNWVLQRPLYQASCFRIT